MVRRMPKTLMSNWVLTMASLGGGGEGWVSCGWDAKGEGKGSALGLFDGAHVGVACVVDEDIHTAKGGKCLLGVAVHLFLRKGEVVRQDLDTIYFKVVRDLGRRTDRRDDLVAFFERLESQLQTEAGIGATDVPDSGGHCSQV